ncbi:amino acid adenylation domain-containing protein [Nostoc sp. NIES-4103]|nr:amino acid adenylation domain-containing protein [Nostoc sp. NIES-4103]
MSASLSYSQAAQWFLHQLIPTSAVHNIAIAVKLQIDLDIPALQVAFNTLAKRHSLLRTTFTTLEGQLIPQVHESTKICFQQEYTLRLVEEAHRPFKIEQNCWRVILFTQSPQEHIILVVAHQLIADLFSLKLLINELGIVYAAQKAGVQPSLTPLNLEFQDYIHLQNDKFAGAAGEKLWSYWQQELSGELPVLNLLGKPRPPIQTYCGASHTLKLDKQLCQQLKVLAESENVTLYTLLLAAFQILLYRYSNQEDIVVGSPTTRKAEFAEIVGNFVNYIVLRSQLSSNSPFTKFLAQVRQKVILAQEHQDFPFPILVERLQPVRDSSYSPLFQVLFAVEQQEFNLEVIPIEQKTARFDLTLTIVEKEDSLRATWQYNTDLFDSVSIARMAGNFQTLLESIIANPTQNVSQLPLLSKEEQHLLLVEWNNTHLDYPKDVYIQQLFEAQVEQTPNAIAVVLGDEKLTYRELNQQANQLAHHLQTLGVEPEKLVGICMDYSLQMIVGILGIMKAGGAYVPLDPAYPQERQAFLLNDAQPEVLLTQEKLLEKIPQTQAKIVCLDSQWDIIAQQSQENPVCRVTGENLAYVIYTSGSTGKPKGVMNTHSGLANAYHCFKIDVNCVIQLASFASDFFLGNLIVALSSGAKLLLCPLEIVLDIEKLYQLIYREQVDIIALNPALLRGLMLYIKLSQQSLDFVKYVVVGSDIWYLHEYQELQQLFEDVETHVINSYGVTECSITNSRFEDSLFNLSIDGIVPVGRPLPNTQFYILDTHLQPVPIGVKGELYIGGDGIARGYLNRPELTAQRFIANPFQEAGESRLYKTGDSARYLTDGNIEYLSRLDNQLKIRGFRIELGEIEAVLSQHPAVFQTAVIAREDVPGDKRLVAYVVLLEKITSAISDLRSFLKQKLPEYMIPAYFVLLDGLPISPNGKVDRKALPAPEIAGIAGENNKIAPRTPQEEILALIWTEVLGIEQIGIHDNFFELGGHSLLATQVISRMRTAWAVEIPLRSLFENPTIAGLAKTVESAQKQEQTIPPLVAIARNQNLPLSFAQQRLWFLNALQPDSAFYNIPIMVRLEGQLNQAALEQSLNEIIQRHEVLRTNFITVDSQPIQIIHPNQNLNVQLLELRSQPEKNLAQTTDETPHPLCATDTFLKSGNPPTEVSSSAPLGDQTHSIQHPQAQQLATQEIQRPFNLTCDPLVRATLLKLSQTDHILLLVIHHIVCDGWSIGILAQELAALYQAFNQQLPSPLPTLPIQYADFAVWQRQWLQKDVLDPQLAYWQKQLADAPALLPLPTDRPRPAVKTFRGAHHTFVLPRKLGEELTILSQQTGVTLFMTLLAAFQTLLYRYSNQTDILVGTPIANRNHADIEPLIGFFVNTLVLRTDFSSNPSFSELLKRVREVTLGAYAHQDVPFELLVEALQPERNLSYTPLFQVLFVMQNTPMPAKELSGLTLTTLPTESQTAKFDLTLSVENTENGLLGIWEYNTDLFDAATITRMTGHFATLLESIIANPEQRVCELPLLTAAEQQQLLVEWNDTDVEYPQDLCIHQLFEQQVERTPNAVAVVFEGKQLTYRELNSRANQLAHYLQRLGVKSEVLVGICVERSLEMVIGLLAVLKAGGAYVPLDPAYPQQRLLAMLEDAQVSVLLTVTELIESGLEEKTQVIYFDRDWERITTESENNPHSQVTADNLIYVIFTSGSTGKPKGVAVEHGQLLNYIYGIREKLQLTDGGNFAIASTFAADLGNTAIFPCLCSGGSLHIISKERATDANAFAEYCQQYPIDCLKIVPSHFAALLTSGQGQAIAPRQRLILGGEATSWDLIEQIQSYAPTCQIFNHYGPTEATVGILTYTVESRPTEYYTQFLPLGRPLPNTQIYILDEHLQPVPVGVPGELYIGGAGLARGYLHQPQLTSERFITHNFGENKITRLYKTGDLARYLKDGNIEYLGRIDNQVKIRGFRIELGEIEAVLNQYPQVQQAVVIAKEDILGDKRLVAYIVPHQQQVPTNSKLRRFLKSKLPDYMVPNTFVILDSIPITPNGKVNFAALPTVEQATFADENAIIAPRDAVELQLTQIWEKVLKTTSVGIKDNFFDLGGHSLLAVSLMAEIQKQFRQSLPLTTLFQKGTIEQLATILRQQPNLNNWSSLVPIQPHGTKQPFFCVHPIGGNVLSYFELARNLGLDQPFYGLQAKGLDGQHQPLTRIADMADEYIKALRLVQPSGPYLLGGWSMGGVVAFEMAQQLQRQGETVALLVLIDSRIPNYGEKNSLDKIDKTALLNYFAIDLAGRFGKNLEISNDTFQQLTLDEQLNYILEQAKLNGILPEDIEEKHIHPLIEVFKANLQALQSYIPQVYSQRITLLQASEILSDNLHIAAFSWDKLTTNSVDIYSVPGNHYTILTKPHVQDLSVQLKRCLDALQVLECQ